MDLLASTHEEQQVTLVGYCLMSNYVHLVAIPRKPQGMALAMNHTQGRYASYWKVRHKSSGHGWQGRFYFCPLDDTHFWAALPYVELNPVRAGLIGDPEAWPGSVLPQGATGCCVGNGSLARALE
jgi:putative transposase